MSGDAQPKKRKNKGRKKDEVNEELLSRGSSDEVIHVHKDAGLGGNAVTKLIFFCLLGALGVMVGFILVQYRGSSDEDTKSAVDSPWSVMFENWVESVPDVVHGEDEHGYGHSEEEEEEEESGGEGGDGSGEHEPAESKEDLEERQSWFSFISLYGYEEIPEDVEGHSGEEADTHHDHDHDEEEEEEPPREEDEEEEEEEVKPYKVRFRRYKPYSEEEEEEKAVSEEDGEEENASEEEQNASEEEENASEEEEEDEGETLLGRGSEEDNRRAGKSKVEESEDSEEEMFPEAIAALKKEQEEEEWARRTQKVVVKEEIAEAEEEPEVEEAVRDEETSGMALKFGVGVALVVVAHVVLVKKWNSGGGAEKPVEKEVREESFAPIGDEPVPTAVPIQSRPEVFNEVVPQPPREVAPKPEEEEEEYDEEEEEEDVEDYQNRREMESELLKKNYEKLLAQFGQPTPESSDPEQSDDEAVARQYSDGGEESVGEEESGGDVEGSDPEEPEAQKWTTIKKSEVATESEDEEEEESEDEAPPVVVARRPAGGQKSVDDYENTPITNEYDWDIRGRLDEADEDLDNLRTQVALSKFSKLLESHPESPRARFGRARALDAEAEAERSNAVLARAIEAYLHALDAPRLPDALLLSSASRAIDRMRFRGQHMKAVSVHKKLIDRFNNTPSYQNDLAINYLMANKLTEAGIVLRGVIKTWPKDHMALAHYGLVLKLQGNHKESIPFLEVGLSVDIPGTRDARLYFHLGDALSREGLTQKALQVYERGVEKGLFRSKYQRSLYNVERLTARPWWTLAQTSYAHFFRKLEENWEAIRDEGLEAMREREAFQDEAENLRDVGDWKQLELYARGQRSRENCRRAPVTCRLIGSFEPARACRRGQSKFSLMEGATHVHPHCGPTNCRLRAHLGLLVPPGPAIRVAETTRTWKEGKVLVFDDSFEHEVWHNGTQRRLVLIVDVWHPELTPHERSTLSAI